MLRGRCTCTISERLTPSLSLRLLATSHPPLATSSLTPLFPLHPRNSPVSPIIPLHTQKQGGGADLLRDAFSPNSFVFSRHSNYILHYTNNKIVGAPTYCTWLATGAGTLKNGSSQKEGPYTNCELSSVNCEQDSPKHAFYREIIKYVGAPTYLIPRTSRKLQSLPASEGGLYKNFQPLLPFFSALLLATSHWSLATKSNVGAPTFPFLPLRSSSQPPPIQFDRCARLLPGSHWSSRRTPATPRSTNLRAILVDS